MFLAGYTLNCFWPIALDDNSAATLILGAMQIRLKRMVLIIRRNFDSQEGWFAGHETGHVWHFPIVGLRPSGRRSIRETRTSAVLGTGTKIFGSLGRVDVFELQIKQNRCAAPVTSKR
jgi:hypothetical protein